MSVVKSLRDMMHSRVLLGTVLAVIVASVCGVVALSRRPPAGKVGAVSTALMDLHRSFLTNGSSGVWSRNAWPASVRALGANGVEAGATRSSLEWAEYVWGIRWSRRYQLL